MELTGLCSAPESRGQDSDTTVHISINMVIYYLGAW